MSSISGLHHNFENGVCTFCGADRHSIHPAYCPGSREYLVGASGDIKDELLKEARNIVNGVRQQAYGSPEDNFERIARFWQAYFLNTGRDIQISASDVSPMMRLLKEARLCASPDHKDSFVDLIGYTLTGADVNNVAPKENKN